MPDCASDWHGSTPCPECGVPRMVAGEPRCRLCAIRSAEEFAAWFAAHVEVRDISPIDAARKD